ncbi:hypothetical protein BDV98DRAFT_417810 [Pterulicium gracile]|uniref:Peptidase C14 caspase domain-containing protein n=1 Tax=Pterulicium gracile TaxID=1884261 RepID=A0A5C3QMX3_9AGAR|nr:hypothetical protein BDV98DRAFT_417810 [Pterula gracilis]
MTSRVFALIVGIDSYKSGNIWNLLSCVDDAKRIKHWLRHKLVVPEDHICMLLDEAATKYTIEESIKKHLVNNPEIQPGDAIVVYFAGHGSTAEAPVGWFSADHDTKTEGDSGTPRVNLLCTYDYDTASPAGRVAGISDRSINALLGDVAAAKGDNILLILDCSFAADDSSTRNRRFTRFTTSQRVQPHDLSSGLWHSAREKDFDPTSGFCHPSSTTHTLFCASQHNRNTRESKDGGRFTTAFIEAVGQLPLHRVSYDVVLEKTASLMPLDQRPFCAGRKKHEYFLDTVAFLSCHQFVQLDYLDGNLYRLGLGSLSSLDRGSKLTVHMHNLHGSANPPVGTVVVQDVHPLWCLARRDDKTAEIPRGCYAKIEGNKIHRRFCRSLLPMLGKLRYNAGRWGSTCFCCSTKT